jgi:hypothetical protein
MTKYFAFFAFVMSMTASAQDWPIVKESCLVLGSHVCEADACIETPLLTTPVELKFIPRPEIPESDMSADALSGIRVQDGSIFAAIQVIGRNIQRSSVRFEFDVSFTQRVKGIKHEIKSFLTFDSIETARFKVGNANYYMRMMPTGCR